MLIDLRLRMRVKDRRAMKRGVNEVRYAVVIEKAKGNFSAYVPDLPGCVAMGKSVRAVEAEIRKAICFHLDGLREDGLPIPEPAAVCEYVEA